MADQIDFKSYSDDKLKKAFDYYKKEYKYAEKRGGRQPLIDRYNDIKNEMINRGFIKGNIDTKIENVKKSENDIEKNNESLSNNSQEKSHLLIIQFLARLEKLMKLVNLVKILIQR